MYIITQDEYFNCINQSKSDELINSVDVPVFCWEWDDYNDNIYKSNVPISFTGIETKTIEINFNNKPILWQSGEDYVDLHAYVTNSSGDLIIDDVTGRYTNTELTSTNVIYSWGAVMTMTSLASCYVIVVAGGYPLKISYETINSSDTSSIAEYGKITYKVPENHLLQSRDTAKIIADELLLIYKNLRKDLVSSWIGDPAIELRDNITHTLYKKGGVNIAGNFKVYKITTIYDGTLRQNIEGRRL